MQNKYEGKCHACGCFVGAYEGILKRHGRKWKVWCHNCYNQSETENTILTVSLMGLRQMRLPISESSGSPGIDR